MSSVVDKSKVPWWVSNLIVPLVNLTLALLVSALFIFIAGENPYKAIKLIIYGSFGYIEGFAYTLYYTTNFIFTGLAFAVAFHCRLFNIGGEGQAYIGGLGAFLVAINVGFPNNATAFRKKFLGRLFFQLFTIIYIILYRFYIFLIIHINLFNSIYIIPI